MFLFVVLHHVLHVLGVYRVLAVSCTFLTSSKNCVVLLYIAIFLQVFMFGFQFRVSLAHCYWQNFKRETPLSYDVLAVKTSVVERLVVYH